MKNLLIMVITSLLIASCGGGGGAASGTSTSSDSSSDQDTTPITAEAMPVDQTVQYRMRISTDLSFNTSFSGQEDLDFNVFFFKYESPISVAAIESFVSEPLGCRVKHQTESEKQEEINAQAEVSNTSWASAGDVLTVTAPTGTWAELVQGSSLPWYMINSDGIHSEGNYPVGTVLNIPGDEFPGVGDIQLTDIERLTGIAYFQNGREINSTVPANANTKFVWNKSSIAGSTVVVEFHETYAGEKNDGESIYSSVRCVAEDTGQFEFPENIRNTMESEYPNYIIYRQINSFDVRDNVLIRKLARSYGKGN